MPMVLTSEHFYFVQGLQATDNSHDARITALEESGGGGSQNGRQ